MLNEEKLVLTTFFEFSTAKNLKTFLKDLKNNIPDYWTADFKPLDQEDISLKALSLLEHEEIIFSTKFLDTETDQKIIASVRLGVFKRKIKILHILINGNDWTHYNKNEYPPSEQDYFEYIFEDFIQTVICPLDSTSLIKNQQFFAKRDLNQNIVDIRMTRPILVPVDKKCGKSAYFHQMHSYDFGKKTLHFTPPNNVALLLSIAKKSRNQAKGIFYKQLTKLLNDKQEYVFNGDDLTRLYDYFEHIQTSIIMSYTAIESFVNIAIPEEYEYETHNGKGIKEIWDKSAIERYKSTSDKLKDFLPNILNIDTPVTQQFWDNFIRLEKLRNDLIHPKGIKKSNLKSPLYSELLKDSVFAIIDSATSIISYFCNADFQK